mmetsp:Transcript_24234/g.63594  ORF Transcript_24234/g.63594 Transcript_24234/m.63594 type:complete len:234 (+) Transcript_24234:50-751(+)
MMDHGSRCGEVMWKAHHRRSRRAQALLPISEGQHAVQKCFHELQVVLDHSTVVLEEDRQIHKVRMGLKLHGSHDEFFNANLLVLVDVQYVEEHGGVGDFHVQLRHEVTTGDPIHEPHEVLLQNLPIIESVHFVEEDLELRHHQYQLFILKFLVCTHRFDRIVHDETSDNVQHREHHHCLEKNEERTPRPRNQLEELPNLPPVDATRTRHPERQHSHRQRVKIGPQLFDDGVFQ